MSQINPTKPRGYGVLTTVVLGALIAATGRPDAETLATLTGWGVPEMAARVGMYVLPVVLLAVALIVGRSLGRGRSTGVRWAIYAGVGAIAGFVLGWCLDIFAALPNLTADFGGPLAEPTLLEEIMWVLAGLCVVLGVMVGAIALFGRPAKAALHVEEIDEEFLEVRRAERAVFGWSALGTVTLGVACGALAMARQAGDDVRLAPILIALAAGLLSVLASYVLWRGFDEMQRRHVIHGYAASAVVATVLTFAWALLEPLGTVPAIDVAGVFVALIAVQLIATLHASSSMMGQTASSGTSP